MTPLRTMRWLMLLVLFVPFARYAHGQVVPEPFEGTWQSRHHLTAIQQGIDEAIQEVVSEMAFYLRPFARSQLREVTAPCGQVEITQDRGRLEIRCNDETPAVSVPDGRIVPYTNQSGDTFQLSQEVRGDRIVQIWRDRAGHRRNTYTLEDDGEVLRIDVRVVSDRLPRPVEFSHTFVSADERVVDEGPRAHAP